MNIERSFAAVERRALAARKTVVEVAEAAGIPRTTLWRAQTGRHKRAESAMKVLRKLETQLDTIEAECAAA